MTAFLAWGYARQTGATCSAGTSANSHQSAASAQSDALASYSSTRSRQGAQIRLHQAASAVREGAVSEGLQYAASIVESLGPHVTQFVLHVAHGVADAVPAGHKTHRAIVEYREQLALTAPKEDK
ncbi:hypothetical protein ABZU75_45215 [Streptosporangium sp. NPDC005286]|uniref:hypothetical protein n=1 Tax=Streptosporangium sp. NPDC005286 TaxID=3154463 RepID=UPI0033A107BD